MGDVISWTTPTPLWSLLYSTIVLYEMHTHMQLACTWRVGVTSEIKKNLQTVFNIMNIQYLRVATINRKICTCLSFSPEQLSCLLQRCLIILYSQFGIVTICKHFISLLMNQTSIIKVVFGTMIISIKHYS